MLDQRSKKIIKKKKHKKKFSGRKKELQIHKDKANHDPETGPKGRGRCPSPIIFLIFFFLNLSFYQK